MDNEENQTVEFYKIKLMEKDRQVSDFEAKLKKIEFKHTRQLKEAKMAQQRAKKLHQQEKARYDKISKQAKQNQEQNSLLQIRLTQLKEQKQKQVAEVRQQYNLIKQQVRSYERILPTHTFLMELGSKIESIPTYEDLFFNLKQKCTLYDQLTQKYEGYKIKMEESVKTYQSNQQMLKTKKLEAEKNLKDLLNKVIDFEAQLADLRSTNEEKLHIIQELNEKLYYQNQKSNRLQTSLKQYEQRIEYLSQTFAIDLQNKEEQIKYANLQKFQRYQQQLKSLSNRLEIKDSMFMQQIAILEEQNSFLQTNNQKQKDKYEESYLEIKEAIEQMKQQVQKQKRAYEELQQKYEQNLRNMAKMATTQQVLEEKLKHQQKLQELLKIKQTSENKRIEKHTAQIQEGYRQLEQKYNSCEDQNYMLRQQLKKIQEENLILTSRIERVESELNQDPNHEQYEIEKLELPLNISQQYDIRVRRKSTQRRKSFNTDRSAYEADRDTFLIKLRSSIENISNQNSQQRNLEQISLANENDYTLIQKNEQLNNEINLKNKHIQELIKQKEIIGKQSEENIEKLKKQFQNQRQKYQTEIKQLKQKYLLASKASNQLQVNLSSLNTKFTLQKTKIQSLQEENNLILKQNQIQKQNNNSLKDELKSYRENQNSSAEKFMKDLKELNQQIELLKNQKQKFKNEFILKEKTYIHQLSFLKSEKEKQEKLKQRINQLTNQIEIHEQKDKEKNKNINELQKDIEGLKDLIQQLKQQLTVKDRENTLMLESLQRERKQRTLRYVPSLQSLHGQQDRIQEQNFSDIYSKVTQKEGQINILNRQVSDLKEQMESLKLAQNTKIQLLEAQMNEYIGIIISMKLKCAESQMKASQKEYLYTQIKKRLDAIKK